MATDPCNQRAVAEAQHIARLYRRAGYPEAQAAPDYCIDELARDGFYTFTVCVYVGEKSPKTMSPLWKRLSERLGLKP